MMPLHTPPTGYWRLTPYWPLSARALLGALTQQGDGVSCFMQTEHNNNTWAMNCVIGRASCQFSEMTVAYLQILTIMQKDYEGSCLPWQYPVHRVIDHYLGLRLLSTSKIQCELDHNVGLILPITSQPNFHLSRRKLNPWRHTMIQWMVKRTASTSLYGIR